MNLVENNIIKTFIKGKLWVEPAYKCKECEQIFLTKQSCRSHIYATHPEISGKNPLCFNLKRKDNSKKEGDK